MKIILSLFSVFCLLSALQGEQPEGMFPVNATFEVLKKETKEKPDFMAATPDVIEVDSVIVRFLEPKEFKGIEYSIYRMPSDPESVIFSESIGMSFRCMVIKHALLNKQREFNSGALTNIKPLKK